MLLVLCVCVDNIWRSCRKTSLATWELCCHLCPSNLSPCFSQFAFDIVPRLPLDFIFTQVIQSTCGAVQFENLRREATLHYWSQPRPQTPPSFSVLYSENGQVRLRFTVTALKSWLKPENSSNWSSDATQLTLPPNAPSENALLPSPWYSEGLLLCQPMALGQIGYPQCDWVDLVHACLGES